MAWSRRCWSGPRDFMRPQRFLCALLLSMLAALPAAALTPYLVKDIAPTGEGMGSDPEFLLALDGGISVWKAYDPQGYPLWRTDGSEAGTYPLIDPGFARFSRLVQAGNRAFFVLVDDFPEASEVWVTGGTPGDTFRVAESLTVAEQNPQALWVPSRGILLFQAGDAETGQELWRSDGTPGGTYLVADL